MTADRKPRLEVLDDELDFSRYICSVANGVGFEATMPESARDFMDNYCPGKELVLLDLYMPDVDGVELLRFMANNLAPAAIILMSGGDNAVLRSARKLAYELDLNVIDIISKPVRKVELENKLKRAIAFIGSRVEVDTSTVVPPLESLQTAILEDKNISIAFQPQVDCNSQKLLGVEALARWTHPDLGAISPMVFISMAETAGLIDKLDLLVLNKAVKSLAEFHRYDQDLRVSVNMSANTFSHLDLPEIISDTLRISGISPDKLAIEVTETALMKDKGRSLDILTRLRMKGVQLSIDDFGTGYSSMSQLVRFPFSELKIDRSFIQELEENPDCRGVVRASVMLAHELGMNAVAEGASCKELLALIKEMGCDISQGYFTGRPMEHQKILELLQRPVAKIV